MTPDDYLAALPDDRRAALATVRQTILDNLPPGYVETMQHGMIAYSVPLDRYPDTYNKQPLLLAGLASQKHHMAVYLTCIYADAEQEQQFKGQWAATGKKLDVGKSCVRFKRLDDVPLDVLGAAIARNSVDDFIAVYERARARPHG